MKVVCPKCSKQLQVPANLIGKNFKCPCGQVLRTKAISVPANTPKQDVADPFTDLDTSVGAPSPYAPPRTETPQFAPPPATATSDIFDVSNGIGRTVFLIASVGSQIALGIVDGIAEALGIPGVPIVTTVLVFVILGLLIGQRYVNIGRSPKWGWAVIVPFLNFVVLINSLIAPEGYAQTKKLDTGGKIGGSVILCLFLAFFVTLYFAINSEPVPSVPSDGVVTEAELQASLGLSDEEIQEIWDNASDQE